MARKPATVAASAETSAVETEASPTVYAIILGLAKQGRDNFAEKNAKEDISTYLRRLVAAAFDAPQPAWDDVPDEAPANIWANKVADAIEAKQPIADMIPEGFPAVEAPAADAPKPKRTGAQALAEINAARKAKKEAEAAAAAGTGPAAVTKVASTKTPKAAKEPKAPKAPKPAAAPRVPGEKMNATNAIRLGVLENPKATIEELVAYCKTKHNIVTKASTVSVTRNGTLSLINLARKADRWKD